MERRMNGRYGAHARAELAGIAAAGLTKREHPLLAPQASHVRTSGGAAVNFCSNDYLGLADHPAVVQAAKDALDERGFGMASVRFISGTQDIHLQLERQLSEFLGTEDTILFPSCFDANGAVFESLLSSEDAVISDALNHASIIDGIRLSKAGRLRYANRDLGELEERLREAAGARFRLIATDGVFSMDGSIAPLDEIVALAEKYDALVLVDDSHAVGVLGERGAGTPELFGVADRIDVLTGTLGKALGGASGGYVAASSEIVALLRQRGRPYLFSNAVPPPAVAGAAEALRLARDPSLRVRLHANAERLRKGLESAGFRLLPGEHPIVPVMFEHEADAVRVAETLREAGIFVTAFSYPVVPLGLPRIRVQLSAGHTAADIDTCVAAFAAAGKAGQ
jgi:glycine C-acetyltransferase